MGGSLGLQSVFVGAVLLGFLVLRGPILSTFSSLKSIAYEVLHQVGGLF